MCDPVSAGLVAVGTGLKAYAGSQVQNASKRNIAQVGAEYDAERGRQSAFTQENQGTVGDTLKTYSPQDVVAGTQGAAANRQTMYTSPLQAHNFTADMPANFDPNSLVMARNVSTGNEGRAKALSQALAKSQLDAYGDQKQAGAIISANNANRIGMVNRIASGSQQAEGIEQGTLPYKLAASAHAGDTAGSVGDAFMLAAMANGMSGGGLGQQIFGGTSSGVPGGAALNFGEAPAASLANTPISAIKGLTAPSIRGSSFLSSTAPSFNFPGVFGMQYPALTSPFLR